MAPEAAEALGITATRLKTLGPDRQDRARAARRRAPRPAGDAAGAEEGARRSAEQLQEKSAEGAGRARLERLMAYGKFKEAAERVEGSRRALGASRSPCRAASIRSRLLHQLEGSRPVCGDPRPPWPEPERRRLGGVLPQALQALGRAAGGRARQSRPARGEGLEAAARDGALRGVRQGRGRLHRARAPPRRPGRDRAHAPAARRRACAARAAWRASRASGGKTLLRPLLDTPRAAIVAYAREPRARVDRGREQRRRGARRAISCAAASGPLLEQRFPAWKQSLARAARPLLAREDAQARGPAAEVFASEGPARAERGEARRRCSSSSPRAARAR